MKLHEVLLDMLTRVQNSRTHPHVMRILAEETVEYVTAILERFDIGQTDTSLNRLPFWRAYLGAIEEGVILDIEYSRYNDAKLFADQLLDHSYVQEGRGGYKEQRYAYALSEEPMPDWFDPDALLGQLEEIITAYCFLWFGVLDFARECRQGAYA